MARALYIDDTVDTCDCCGKTGLKKTVCMKLDDDSIVHYGVICAGRNTNKDQRQIKQEVIKYANDLRGMASNEWRSTVECKQAVALRLSGLWKEIGMAAYEAHPIMQRAEAKRKEIATKYHIADF